MRNEQITLERRDATARPSSWDAEARTIEAVIASNAPVTRRDASGEFLEVLDPKGADLSALIGASVLDSHRADGVRSILGVVEAARVEGNEIVATLRMSAKPDVADIVRDIGDGILRNLSVGYDVSKWRDATDSITKARTRTAVAWRPREVSFVGISADSNAKTRTQPMDTTTTMDRPSINRAIRELAARAGAAAPLTDGLIDREASIEDARQAVLDDMITRGSVPIRSGGRNHNETSLDNPEVFQRAASEALYTRILPSFEPSPQARQYVGMSCADLARECLNRVGINVTGLQAQALITRALQSSSDYPLVLANVLNKSMRDAYAVAESGIRRIARETTANDFRAKSRIQFDHSGFKLEQVGETGEFKYGSFIDTAESYSVDSYGKLFTISRKALVNDDLGAFADVTRRVGLAAAEFERQFLVDLLTSNAGLGPKMSDGAKLFDASHGNVSTTGAAPDEGTLSAARLAMRDQVGPGGGLISVVPRYLVVPSEMETACEKLLTSIQAVETADVNPFAFLDLIVEPRLTNAKRWYLAADPARMEGIEFAYLAGAPGPQTESRAGFEVDGVSIKVRLDYGAGCVEHRSLYTNAGQ